LHRLHALSAAQKIPSGALRLPDPEFSPAFYGPYTAAIETTLREISAVREAHTVLRGEDCIRAITFRLKSPASIRDKLRKKGLPASARIAACALRDIAGLRVVLSDVDAVYSFASLLRESSALCCFAEHDYIRWPKRSGYKSLHLLVQIAVSGVDSPVPAEIQLRTLQMDEWASIEHEIIYKPRRS